MFKSDQDIITKMKFNNYFIFIFIAVCFKFSLDFSYVSLIVEPYHYIGLDYEYAPVKILISYLSSISLFTLSYKNKILPSYYFTVLLLLITWVPLSTIYAFSSYPSQFYYQVTFLFLLLILIVKYIKLSVYSFKIPIKFISFFSVGLFLLVLVFIVFSLYKMNFNLNFNTKLLYQTREIFHANVANGVVGYLYTFITKSILVFFMSFSLYKKNYISFFILMSLEILISGMSNHKAIFLYPFLIIFIHVLLRNKISPSIMLFGFLTIVIVGDLLTLIGVDKILIIFILRMFFVSSVIDYKHYVFFQDNPFTYFSNSFLAGLIDYNYTELIPDIIGFGMWEPDKAGFANTGAFGSGYMHMGFLGMFLFTMVIALVFLLSDAIASKHHRGYLLVIPSLIVSVRTFNSADMGSVLFSHGLLLTLLLLFLYYKNINR
jgi:hypothetical protein